MKISTSVHVRGWAIYDLGKRFNIAIHLLNLQSRNFILNIRIRKYKLYLSVRHPVLKSLSGDWTDVIINTLCYQFLILFLFERPLSERRKDGFPNCMGPGKCSSFPFFQFCFLSNHNGPDLIVPLFKAFTSQISFSSSRGICFWQHVKIVLLCWVKLFIAWQLVSVKKLIFSELVRSSFEGVRSLRNW